jgi:hypothetical protein
MSEALAAVSRMAQAEAVACHGANGAGWAHPQARYTVSPGCRGLRPRVLVQSREEHAHEVRGPKGGAGVHRLLQNLLARGHHCVVFVVDVGIWSQALQSARLRCRHARWTRTLQMSRQAQVAGRRASSRMADTSQTGNNAMMLHH